MALIHNNNLGLYAGVSKQALDLRLPTHCEEMVNCYPTIHYGLRRRNPTAQLSTNIIVEENQFMHSYDRGLAGESSEQYLITIDKTNGLRVFDIYSGEYRTVTYSGDSEQYLESANPELSFSAITIKDTTFIANRDVIPLRIGEGSVVMNTQRIVFSSGYDTFYPTIDSLSQYAVPSSTIKQKLAPARFKTFKGTYTTTIKNDDSGGYIVSNYTVNADSSSGATLTFTVDGNDYSYTVYTKRVGYNIYPETLSEMRVNIYKLLYDKLPLNEYVVKLGVNNDVVIARVDGAAISVSSSISFPASVDTMPPAISELNRLSYPNGNVFWMTAGAVSYAYPNWTYQYESNLGSTVVSNIVGGTSDEAVVATSNYGSDGFIWIKQTSVDPAYPYTFYATLVDANGATISSTSTSSTSTTGVASALASWANGVTGFVASANGSVVKINRSSGSKFFIRVSDTYGNQASSAWVGEVSSINDIPKSFPFNDTVVKVGGIQRSDDVAYWLKYDGNAWVEWRDPSMPNVINQKTMPHQLTRNADLSFTFAPIEWDPIKVGDEDSQVIPEIFGNEVKDLFFIGGRLGLLSKNGITLSQQGNFKNLFRTTILSMLDDSAISTYIDSNKSVGLQYAVELQGNIILFGDKLQFAIDANKAITPATISVRPVSGFEINKNVKPISVGDSVFFLINKMGYSALMEMNQTTVSMNIRAVDVSAHVPNYIDTDIVQLTASQRDNVIFLRSRINKDTLYVYKYYGTETEKQQTAWSKWVFNMEIHSTFAFDKQLYLFGSRYDTIVPIDTYPLATVWSDIKAWNDATTWVDGEVATTPSFEVMTIDAGANDILFKDIETVDYVSEVELSKWAITSNTTSQKELRGNLLVKTIEVSSSNGSNFSLDVIDIARSTMRNVPAKYTVNRKPFVGGNADNMVIKIKSVGGDGFQINSISLEGQYNVRSKRV